MSEELSMSRRTLKKSNIRTQRLTCFLSMVSSRKPTCTAGLGLSLSTYLLAEVRMGRDPDVIAM
jgi:hypothetical protein